MTASSVVPPGQVSRVNTRRKAFGSIETAGVIPAGGRNRPRAILAEPLRHHTARHFVTPCERYTSIRPMAWARYLLRTPALGFHTPTRFPFRRIAGDRD